MTHLFVIPRFIGLFLARRNIIVSYTAYWIKQLWFVVPTGIRKLRLRT